MGWVINYEKEREKAYLISNITEGNRIISSTSDEIRNLAERIHYIIGGLPSGTDVRWIGCCQRAMNNLARTSTLLRETLINAKELNVMEYHDDGDK